MNDRDQDKRLDGPDVLYALSHGDTIDAIKLAALDEARALYGEDAPLRIERVGSLNTAVRRSKGRFFAEVTVRCLELPEGW
jgi:hypothetical protein